MSLSMQTLKRLPTIKQGLLEGLNYTTIGKKCGVTERTIDRDVHAWLESGQFETWIKQEWLRLHNIVLRKHPVEAYKQITRLLGQTLTRRMEVKEEIKVEEKHVSIVADYTKAIEAAVNRDVEALRARKQVDTETTTPSK
jgi:hypothetical protein